jgi:hypothetical protein
MQKVEGSSPFIRFTEPAGNGGFFSLAKMLFSTEAMPRSGSGQVPSADPCRGGAGEHVAHDDGLVPREPFLGAVEPVRRDASHTPLERLRADGRARVYQGRVTRAVNCSNSRVKLGRKLPPRAGGLHRACFPHGAPRQRRSASRADPAKPAASPRPPLDVHGNASSRRGEAHGDSARPFCTALEELVAARRGNSR